MNYLSYLNIGDKVKIERIDDSLELKERLIDMGFTKDSEIECILKACFNGPIAYRIKNTTIYYSCPMLGTMLIITKQS